MSRFAAIARIEASPPALTALKIANASLTLVWGFAVTYVFVRVLPITDFRAFLILIAFGNFVIGAEFGLTTMLYSRMRRHWLANDPEAGHSYAELPYLFTRLALLVVIAIMGVSLAIGAGAIATQFRMLFLLFFSLSCLNVLVILLKRALSAIDQNALWEVIDAARRLISLGLLIAILAGAEAATMVALMVAIAVAALTVGIAVANRQLRIDAKAWWGRVALSDEGRTSFWRAGRQSALLTVSEVAIYNAPYLTIGLMTGDPRPVLIYDFLYKLVRGFYTLLRAIAEGALPRLTSAFYRGEASDVRHSWRRLTVGGLALTAGVGLALWLVGQRLFAELYDGSAAISRFELTIILVILAAFVPIAFSVLFQGPLGRFANLLTLSLPLLGVTLLCAPLAALIDPVSQLDFTSIFIAVYASGFAMSAWLHTRSIDRLIDTINGRLIR